MWFFGLIVVLLIGAVAVVASGRWGAMNTAYDDRPDMTVPARQALTSTDIESARFAVGVRGYRMDEVDTLLERVAKEVAERDRRIADLERAVAPIVEAPDGHGFTSRPYDPTEFEDTGTQPPILVGGDFPATDDPTDTPGSTGDTAEAGSAVGADGPGGSAHEAASAADADEASATPHAAGAADGANGPDGTAHASGGPGGTAYAAGAAGSADGSGGSAHAAGGAGSADEAGGTADASGGADEAGSTAGAGGSEDGPAGAAYADEVGDADEPETSELPRASRAAADEYERLQAEARAVLEAQSQPVSPRRTPAPQQPSGESASLTPAQRYDQLVQNQRPEQPAPSQSAPAEPDPDSQQTATHWTSQPPQQEQAGPTEQAQQQTPQQQGGVEAANGAAGDEEGWRFWPPADQAGEGAYQRPS